MSYNVVRLKYLIRRNKRAIILATIFGIALHFIIQSTYFSQPQFEIDDSYEGTFRGRYLKTIKSTDELKSPEFYNKWSIIGYLDDLVNETIELSTFENSIDPFSIIESYELENTSFIYNQLSALERAQFYEDHILPLSKYEFKDIQDIIYKDAFYSKKFINTRLKKWLKIKQHLTTEELESLKISDEWFKTVVKDIKDLKLKHNQISSDEIKNSFTQLKFFSNIFLNPKQSETPELDKICTSTSEKLFPWLSGLYPKFYTYTNRMEKIDVTPFTQKDSTCFIKSLQQNLHGKGIVITSNNALIPELSGLLSILRLTGNQLPIYVVHNNDLSLESIKVLNNIANEPIMKLPKDSMPLKIPNKLKPLNIIYIDVSNTINNKYKKYFGGFGMKLLAYLFNPNEEMIMLDTDTVIVDDINKFFNDEKYLNNGAYFFKDRDVNSFIYEGLMDYFKSYLNYDKESHYLGMERVQSEVLENRFFGSFARHFMESGLFVINKKEKFDGVIASTMMQMFKLFTGSLHGEKEFIWLGQEIMGNKYEFNEKPAIAIGELSPNREGLTSKELCTTHPAHISKINDLLWFNSGFLTCKKFESYYKDINYERNKGLELIDIKRKYLSPLHITHGILPPPAEYNIEVNNVESTRGWRMTQECSNYMWCAYDKIGIEETSMTGEIIEFDESDTIKWDYLGKLWVNYYNKGYIKNDHGYIEGDAYDELGIDKIDIFNGDKSVDDDENNEIKNSYGKSDYDDDEEEGEEELDVGVSNTLKEEEEEGNEEVKEQKEGEMDAVN